MTPLGTRIQRGIANLFNSRTIGGRNGTMVIFNRLAEVDKDRRRIWQTMMICPGNVTNIEMLSPRSKSCHQNILTVKFIF